MQAPPLKSSSLKTGISPHPVHLLVLALRRLQVALDLQHRL